MGPTLLLLIKNRVKFYHGAVQRSPYKVQPRVESLPYSRSMLWIRSTPKLPRAYLFSIPDHKEPSLGEHAGVMLNLTWAGLYIEPSGGGSTDDRLMAQSLANTAPCMLSFPMLWYPPSRVLYPTVWPTWNLAIPTELWHVFISLAFSVYLPLANIPSCGMPST